jgi:hypothetical protein
MGGAAEGAAGTRALCTRNEPTPMSSKYHSTRDWTRMKRAKVFPNVKT